MRGLINSSCAMRQMAVAWLAIQFWWAAMRSASTGVVLTVSG